MVENSYIEFIESKELHELYDIMHRMNKNTYPEHYQYVKNKIANMSPNEKTSEYNFNSMSLDEILLELENTDKEQLPIKSYLLESLLKEKTTTLRINRSYLYSNWNNSPIEEINRYNQYNGRFNAINIKKVINGLIIHIILSIIIYFVYTYLGNTIHLGFYVSVVGLPVLIYIVAFFYHLVKSINTKLTVDGINKVILLDEENKNIRLPFNDIKRIEVYLSPPVYRKGMLWLPWDELYFTKIIMVGGKEYSFSSFILAKENLFLKIHNVYIDKKINVIIF